MLSISTKTISLAVFNSNFVEVEPFANTTRCTLGKLGAYKLTANRPTETNGTLSMCSVIPSLIFYTSAHREVKVAN